MCSLLIHLLVVSQRAAAVLHGSAPLLKSRVKPVAALVTNGRGLPDDRLGPSLHAELHQHARAPPLRAAHHRSGARLDHRHEAKVVSQLVLGRRLLEDRARRNFFGKRLFGCWLFCWWLFCWRRLGVA